MAKKKVQVQETAASAAIDKPTPGYSGTSGNRYRFAGEARPKMVRENGQVGPIVRALESAGKVGATSSELAKAIAGSIQTVQTPLRVVRFYVSEWRKRGLIVSA